MNSRQWEFAGRSQPGIDPLNLEEVRAMHARLEEEHASCRAVSPELRRRIMQEVPHASDVQSNLSKAHDHY
eukprot:scaffold23082_cov19-Prasinocladus_malaysianus.AAC.1